jgi:hypothetical protein
MIFGSTLVIVTFPKTQRISNDKWNSVLDLNLNEI